MPFCRFPVAALLLLAACSGTAPAPPSEPPQEQTIRVWHTELDKGAQASLQRIADRMKKEKHINVEAEAVSWAALADRISVATQTGELPDVAHLQPFYMSSFVRRDLLVDLTDVDAAIGGRSAYPAVRDIGLFNGRIYGIPYAVGTTYWSYRADLAASKQIKAPADWNGFIALAQTLHDPEGKETGKARYGTVLPGGSPFFVDQLAIEMLASNGGTLVQNGKVQVDTPEFIGVLTALKLLADLSPPNWRTIAYQDQFRLFATGQVATVPVTYARAAKEIESSAPPELASPSVFAVLPPLHGPLGTKGYATVDAEPWVVFKSSSHQDAAKEFLREFYQADQYADFCTQIPIHLTPILPTTAALPAYAGSPFLAKWAPWNDASKHVLEAGDAHPILESTADDRHYPFLFEIQASGAINGAVAAVAQGETPANAAKAAQAKIDALVSQLEAQK